MNIDNNCDIVMEYIYKWSRSKKKNCQTKQKKRKFMEFKKEQENCDNSLSLSKYIKTESKETQVLFSPDILVKIFSYLDPEDLCEVCLVCSIWKNVSNYDVFWKARYYESNEVEALIELIQEEEEIYSDEGLLYSVGATWKPSHVYKALPHIYPEDGIYDQEAEKEEITLKGIIDNIGAPLCSSTLEDQYKLIQENFCFEDFEEVVRNKLNHQVAGINSNQYKALYLQKIQNQNYQTELYQEFQDARYMERDTGLVMGEDDDQVYDAADKDNFEAIQKDAYPELLKTGIYRIFKQGGVLYFEPEIIETVTQLLKDYLREIIQEAAKKLDGKQIVYTETNYTGFWSSETDCHENDDVDQPFKINAFDIVEAVEKVKNIKLYGFLEEHIKRIKMTREFGLFDFDIDDSDIDNSDIDDSEVDEATISVDVDNLRYSSDEDMSITNLSKNGEDFIDDSDIDEYIKTVDINNLGNSLEDELLKISINIHEEIYGKERAHKDKLYLKNWLFNSDSIIYKYAKINEDYDDDPHSDYSAKTEQQLIEEIKKEDIDCFGYSILDDDKISGTLTSSKKMQMKYELRKKLRQQSFDCIKNFQL
eukprot:TRINITY_DN2192_c0_g1_i1.p1 TRINITY_DN2192_c0_g1~~TRINITY_DN2192_c0_g1_i1.p1  ORF type:complete len:592 (-),score=81.78 TRINITY_DN2192_c0_g1_i1:248-2023(-)